jgi:tetrahydromethanopterin S-methyltransferase subunit C
MKSAVVVTSACALALIIAWEIARAKFVRLVKTRAPELWESLGRPRGVLVRVVVLLNDGVERYLLKRQFMISDDVALRIAALRTRRMLVAYRAGMTVWLVVFVSASAISFLH